MQRLLLLLSAQGIPCVQTIFDFFPTHLTLTTLWGFSVLWPWA